MTDSRPLHVRVRALAQRFDASSAERDANVIRPLQGTTMNRRLMIAAAAAALLASPAQAKPHNHNMPPPKSPLKFSVAIDPPTAVLPPAYYADPKGFCRTIIAVAWLQAVQNNDTYFGAGPGSSVVVMTKQGTLSCGTDGSAALHPEGGFPPFREGAPPPAGPAQ
jgi:hypothetical protein